MTCNTQTNACKFYALDYTSAQWKAALQAGNTTIWDGVEAGVTLSLAAGPLAATERYMTANS